MAFKADLKEAAHRHYGDAKLLQDSRRFSGAGYHYGLAAECAIKAKLSDCGVRDDDAAMWLHFPALIGTARQVAQGRAGGSLAAILNRPNLMSGWAIRMRYARNGMV